MDLEKLPQALQEMKDKVLASVIEEIAPVANDELVAALAKRIAAQGSGNKRNKPVTSKAVGKKLNQQQQKFLKQAPAVEPGQPGTIQALKQNDKYVITAMGGGEGDITVTNTDIANYRKTISEQAKKLLDNLL